VRRLVADFGRSELNSASGLVASPVAVRVLRFVSALVAIRVAVAVIFIIVATGGCTACLLLYLHAPPMLHPGSQSGRPGRRTTVPRTRRCKPQEHHRHRRRGLARRGSHCRPESHAIPVAVRVLIDPGWTHPIPVAAACLACVGNPKVLGIIFSTFVLTLLHSIAISVLVSVPLHLRAVAGAARFVRLKRSLTERTERGVIEGIEPTVLTGGSISFIY
jgi:hypothetical protein